MSIEDRIKSVMKKGWNVHIECKGKGREYELSYEATANRIPKAGDSQKLITLSFYPIHSVGDTLEELISNIESKINEKEKSDFLS